MQNTRDRRPLDSSTMSQGLAAHVQWQKLFMEQHPVGAVSAVTNKAYWFDLLDKLGATAILEFIAGGRLPAEIAIANNIPLLFFREWFETRVPKDQLRYALGSFADVCVLKSQLTLTTVPGTPQEATVQKELSTRLQWMAERINPEQWMPPKGQSAALPMVNIQFNLEGASGVKQSMQLELAPTRVPVDVQAEDDAGDNPFDGEDDFGE